MDTTTDNPDPAALIRKMMHLLRMAEEAIGLMGSQSARAAKYIGTLDGLYSHTVTATFGLATFLEEMASDDYDGSDPGMEPRLRF